MSEDIALDVMTFCYDALAKAFTYLRTASFGNYSLFSIFIAFAFFAVVLGWVLNQIFGKMPFPSIARSEQEFEPSYPGHLFDNHDPTTQIQDYSSVDSSASLAWPEETSPYDYGDDKNVWD